MEAKSSKGKGKKSTQIIYYDDARNVVAKEVATNAEIIETWANGVVRRVYGSVSSTHSAMNVPEE